MQSRTVATDGANPRVGVGLLFVFLFRGRESVPIHLPHHFAGHVDEVVDADAYFADAA